jgi:UDPglucose 6-dehydrogenase
VVCVDIDQAKVEGLNSGVDPDLRAGPGADGQGQPRRRRLSFTTDAAAAIAHGDVIFIAVGTPPDEDGSADLSTCSPWRARSASIWNARR